MGLEASVPGLSGLSGLSPSRGKYVWQEVMCLSKSTPLSYIHVEAGSECDKQLEMNKQND